jgi:hypothetical protein
MAASDFDEAASDQGRMSHLHRQAVGHLVHLRRNSRAEIMITALANPPDEESWLGCHGLISLLEQISR